MSEFHPNLRLVDPLIPEMGWELEPVPQAEFAPNVRHINRYRKGFPWLGPGIEKPPNERPPEAA